MTDPITRRDALKLLGGVAVGTFLTPLPWKVLDDVAIWTQNEDWAQALPRGERSVRRTHCPLCPAGCALAVRCVEGRAFAISGVPDHPWKAGKPCPLGLLAHHFALHPRRLRSARLNADARPRDLAVSEAMTVASTWLHESLRRRGPESVAVLDLRPGRSFGGLARSFLSAAGGGRYVVMPSEASPLQVARRTFAGNTGEDIDLAWNLAACRTVLSFGAPLLDGWGTPDRVSSVLMPPDGSANSRPWLAQIEPVQSRTAQGADRWLAIRPGTEAVLALGIAHAILRDEAGTFSPDLVRRLDPLGDQRERLLDLLREVTPARAARITGLGPKDVHEIARRFAHDGPSVAIAGFDAGAGRLGREEELALHVLNLLVDAIGPDRPIVPRRVPPTLPEIAAQPLAKVTELEDVANGSLDLLVVDASTCDAALPWPWIRRKLERRHGRVVVLTPYEGEHARRADLALPTAAALEAWAEIGAAPDAPETLFALSAPLHAARWETIEPEALLTHLARGIGISFPPADLSDRETLIERRVQAIHGSSRGVVIHPDGTRESLDLVPMAEGLHRVLREGGGWIDEPMTKLSRTDRPWLSRDDIDALRELIPGRLARFATSGSTANLTLMPHGWRVAAAGQPLPPVLSKLCRESDLRESEGNGWIHPRTARGLGARDDSTLEVAAGGRRIRLRVHLDTRVPCDVILAPVGMRPDVFGDVEPAVDPSVLDLGSGDAGVPARLIPVTVVEV